MSIQTDAGQDAVARELFDDTDRDFTGSNSLYLVSADESDENPPAEVAEIMGRHGWERSESEDMIWCPDEQERVFAYRPN